MLINDATKNSSFSVEIAGTGLEVTSATAKIPTQTISEVGSIALASDSNKVVLATIAAGKLKIEIDNYMAITSDMSLSIPSLKTLDGSCRSPISASAYIIENDRLKLYGAIARLDGTKVVKSEIVGLKKDAVLLGKNLGTEILSKANGEIIYK